MLEFTGLEAMEKTQGKAVFLFDCRKETQMMARGHYADRAMFHVTWIFKIEVTYMDQ